MSLTNAQYDAVMRIYSKRQSDAARDLESRRQEAYSKIPELESLNASQSRLAVSMARACVNGAKPETGKIRGAMAEFSEKKRNLLIKAGYPGDYLEPKYICPDCRDTGFADGRPCHCFRQAAIELLCEESGLDSLNEEASFSSFSLDYYSAERRHPVTGKSERENMEEILSFCRGFADNFESSGQSLFFYGDTGLGKTYLSHCIARELLSRAIPTVYCSAHNLFEQLAQEAFGKEDRESGFLDYVCGCSLLILDDLGTELTNAFVSSRLFLIINERLLAGRSTIISTNLPLSGFADLYSERIFSRIMSSYRLFNFFGTDIRLQKKLGGHHGK